MSAGYNSKWRLFDSAIGKAMSPLSERFDIYRKVEDGIISIWLQYATTG